MGDPLGEPGGGAPLQGALKVMKGRDGQVSTWGLSWVACSVLIYRRIREMVESGSGGGIISLSVGAL
jgi:hypothetical protein